MTEVIHRAASSPGVTHTSRPVTIPFSLPVWKLWHEPPVQAHRPALTEARLWEEPERLLGSMEEMPLRVSLLLLPGLCTLRLE